jgi:hypothetical protein
MQYLLTFDENCPSNMGKSQLVKNIQEFLNERELFLPSATFTDTKLTYKGADGQDCYATIKEVNDDFTNT